MATQNPTTQTPPIIDMGISQFNTTTQTPPPTQTITQTPEDKIKSGTATAQDFAAYNIQKGSQTAGSELLKQVKPTQVPASQSTTPKIDMGISSFDVQQTTPTQPIAPTTPTPITPQRQGEELKPVAAPEPNRELMPGETVSPTKIDATSTKEQIQARQEQLYNNLNSLYSANDQQLKSIIDSGDYEKYIARFNTTNPDEKKIVDAFYQANQPKDIDGYLNILKSGQKIQLKSTLDNPDYKIAQDIYGKLNTYKGYSADQFATLVIENKLIPGEALYNELMKDPNIATKLSQANQLNIINKRSSDTQKLGETQTEEILNKNLTLKKAFEDNNLSQEEYDQLYGNPEIKNKKESIKPIQDEYLKIKAEYNDIENTIRNQYKGTGALEGYIQSKIGKAQKDIFKRLTIAQDNYNSALGEIKDLESKQAALADINLKRFEIQEGREFQKAQTEEERAYQEKQYRLQQSFANPDINSTDPQIATIAANKSVNDILKFAQENGIVIKRDSATILNDAKKFAQENGVSLGEALNTTFTSIVTGGEQYKTVMEGIQRTKIGDKYDYKAVQGTDANGNLITTGYIAINKQDPTDTFSIGLDGQRITAGTGGGFDTTSIPGTGETITAGGNANQNLTSLRGTVIKNTKNVGNDLNNPGNLTRGGVGDKYAIGYVTVTDTKGIKRDFLVFPTLESGYAGVQEDLKAKMTGGSRYVKPTDSLSKLLDVWVGGNGAPQKYKNAVSKASGYNLNNPVSGMDYTKVMAGIKQAEGVGSKVGNDYTSLAPKTTSTTTQTGTSGTYTEEDFKNYFKSGTLPKGLKSLNAANGEIFKNSYQEWKKTNNPLSDREQGRVWGLADDYRKDKITTKATALAPLVRQYSTIDASKMSASDKQALISDYAKALDPESVVREGEYATVAKYSQSLVEKYGEQIKQAISGDGVLNEDATNALIRSVLDRAKATFAEEQSVRKSYIDQINRVTNRKDGEMELITPLKNFNDVVRYSDGTYKEYDGQGNYRYYGKDKKLSEWKPVGKSTATGPVAPKKSPQTESYLKSIGIQ